MDCYLLEFSVMPGGSRLADVHAHWDLDSLRIGFDTRWGREGEDNADAYLVMWYGAVLHLWVVRGGEIVEGMDLHPFLRTADPRYDAALHDVIGEYDEEFRDFFELVAEAYPFQSAATLPLLHRGLHLCRLAADGDDDAAEELEAISDELMEATGEGRAPVLPYPVISNCLHLDWDGIVAALASMEPPGQPASTTGDFHVRWADAPAAHPESHLRRRNGVTLHFGVNDLEIGEDEYLEDGYGIEAEAEGVAP